MVPPRPYLRRQIYDLCASFDATEDGVAVVDIIANDRCLFHQAMNQRGSSFRWVAFEGQAIDIKAADTFRLEVHAEAGIGRLHMFCRDWIDDEYPFEVCEQHTFPPRGPAQVLSLYPDDSLAARRQRAEDRARYEAYADDNVPSDDEIDARDAD